MKILYFAWLRQRIGTGEENVAVPENVTDVAGLIKWLKTRGDSFEEALQDVSAIRVAINQEFATPESKIAPDDEVALFPPMTGG